ncbi:LCR [Medicago truncatula]|uniref:LCR n=1 Tax=Medicago truncatula TaxID=3880 RepID=A0A072UAP5_MEDTR|nr:LCR [Medicago truncatula]
MAFSFYQSFLFLILCIALVLPSGLAIGSVPDFQCIAPCEGLPEQCPVFCNTRGFKRGGGCQVRPNGKKCCCLPNPPELR